MNDGIN